MHLNTSLHTIFKLRLLLKIIFLRLRTFVDSAARRDSQFPIPIALSLSLSPCHLLVVFVVIAVEFGSVLFDRLITHRRHGATA